MKSLQPFILVSIFICHDIHAFLCNHQFLFRPQKSHNIPTERRYSVHRQNVELPLLDLTESEYLEKMIQPLPSAHLPDELTTLNVYGMEMTRPVHQMVIDDAIVRSDRLFYDGQERNQRLFGHVAYKKSPTSLVGAIGCVSEVLMNAQAFQEEMTEYGRETNTKTVLCRGSFRFIVREVLTEIPFPVAIVDELVDDEIQSGATSSDKLVDQEGDDDDDDDDDDDFYADFSPSELVQRTLVSMNVFVEQQLEACQTDLSPLEQAILDQNGRGLDMAAQHQAADEMAAVFDVFQSSLIDICPEPRDRYYAIAMLAAEMSNMSNQIRRKILSMTNGVERMRFVLKELDDLVGMARARKMANQITDKTSETEKDLKVGTPQLPPWASSIRKGMKVEYYWNEDWGWCRGEVVEEPIKILDEIILSVYFPDDGSTHKLPFTAEEKVRWRPPQ